MLMEYGPPVEIRLIFQKENIIHRSSNITSHTLCNQVHGIIHGFSQSDTTIRSTLCYFAYTE